MCTQRNVLFRTIISGFVSLPRMAAIFIWRCWGVRVSGMGIFLLIRIYTDFLICGNLRAIGELTQI